MLSWLVLIDLSVLYISVKAKQEKNVKCVFEQYDEVNGYDKKRFLRVCLVSIIQ